ncbi:MAG: IS110 family transposase [Chloroflexota bacterium]
MGKKKKQTKKVEMDVLSQINPNAAGLDIGSQETYACVPEGRSEESVRSFGTCTPDINEMRDWLLECDITTVALESTGIYWIATFEILEAAGIEVYLVNAQATKNVSGRKTDVLDCQWIQQLHTYGLLQASFRPSADIGQLRSYVRHRGNLIQQVSKQIQLMQKALNLMNLKLTSVIKDITGVTGMQIIRSILDGERDALTLAKFRDPRCKSTEEEIAKALAGNYQDEHLFALKQAVEAYDFYLKQLADCDHQLVQVYAAFEPQVDINEHPLPETDSRKQGNQPDFDLRTFLYCISGVDLTTIDGIDVLIAQTVISEVGIDMTKWKSDKHFASWLGTAPNNKESAGKIISRHTKKTKNRANTALRLAAQSVARSQSALGAFYRRIRAKHGKPVAITATANKLARIVYRMLKDKVPYRDPGLDTYNEQQRSRELARLNRLARKLGVTIVSDEQNDAAEAAI